MLIKRWEIGNYHDGWNDGFYRAALYARLVPPDLHIVRVSVERIDSGEKIGGIQKSGNSVGEAVGRINLLLTDYINNLPRPPVEWGRPELRSLLTDYRAFNDELVGFLIQLKTLDPAGDLCPGSFHDVYWKSVNFTIKNSALFTQRLAAMSEQDKVDLMTSPDFVYQDLTDPWNLDDYDSRAALFDFIVNPSHKVKEGHQDHLRSMTTHVDGKQK